MKKNLVKTIGITISTILILQNSQVFAVTRKEIQQRPGRIRNHQESPCADYFPGSV